MGADSYWARRSVEREEEWNRKSRETIEKELASHYERSAQRIQAQIEQLYGKFATDNGVSITEARKLINGNEFRIWRKDIEEYIAEYKETGNPKTLLELNTLAMRSRISRLDKLYGDTLIELDKLGQKTDATITGFLKEAYKDNRLHSAYELAKRGQGPLSVAVDNKQVEHVLRTPWSGKNYSERIWKNSDKLARTIQDTIVNGVHRGVSVDKLAKEVQERMGVSKNDAVRLVRTEMNYVNNQAALDSIKDAKMKYYQFIATLDKRTSSTCREHDGKVYLVSEAEIGNNVPPLHPRCRSTIAGTLGPAKPTKGSRIAKDEPQAKGEAVRYKKVPRNMDYDDWKAVYVDKAKPLEDWQKERKQYSSLPNNVRNKTIPDVPTKVEKPKTTMDIAVPNNSSNNASTVIRKPQDLTKVKIGESRVKEARKFFDNPSYNDMQRMGKNLIPLSDAYIEMVLLRNLNDRALKKHIDKNKSLESFVPYAYTIGKDSVDRWFTDDGEPLYPPNNGAIGESWRQILPINTILSRYGSPYGTYTAPSDILFVNRAMPYNEEYYEKDHHRYIVLKPLTVEVGIVAPAFNQSGGGIQYKTEQTIKELLELGYLKEVDNNDR